MATMHRRLSAIGWQKLIGFALLCVPIGLLLLLGIGEMAGGIVSGLQHLAQLAPLVFVAILAWKRPHLGGAILVGLGTLLAALYPFMMGGRFPVWALLVNDLMLFGLPIAAGLLLLAARDEVPRRTATGGAKGTAHWQDG